METSIYKVLTVCSTVLLTYLVFSICLLSFAFFNNILPTSPKVCSNTFWPPELVVHTHKKLCGGNKTLTRQNGSNIVIFSALHHSLVVGAYLDKCIWCTHTHQVLRTSLIYSIYQIWYLRMKIKVFSQGYCSQTAFIQLIEYCVKRHTSIRFGSGSGLDTPLGGSPCMLWGFVDGGMDVYF